MSPRIVRAVKMAKRGSLPHFLRSARLAQGMRLLDVARALGVSIETISRAELPGKPPLSQETLVRLACVLGVDVDEALRLAGFILEDIRKALMEPRAFAAVRDLIAEVSEVE